MDLYGYIRLMRHEEYGVQMFSAPACIYIYPARNKILSEKEFPYSNMHIRLHG